jgi:transcription-repair coupling factor (superfamily II helicase)
VEEVDALGEELADRFGELPEPARSLLDIARLGLLCRALDIASLRAGPEAVAITPREHNGLFRLAKRLTGQVGTRQSGERLLLEITESRAETRLSILLDVLGDGSRRADRQHPARAATRKKMVRTSGLDSAPEVEPARAEGAQGS